MQRSRSRTRAQRTESRYRQTLISSVVAEFNRMEAMREREALLKAIGELPAMIGDMREFSSEYGFIAFTIAIVGYLNWFLISGLPVELSRHTEIGRTMTAVVMAHIGG